ncbi:MAG: mycothiol synthase [Pseudoclavibacter sp.]
MNELETHEGARAHADAVLALARAATDRDGAAPFNDDALLRLDERMLVAVRDDAGGLAGAALAHAIDEGLEAELVVHPDARRLGLGRALIGALAERTIAGDDLVVWAHGNGDAARALAGAVGMRESRVLYKLGREVVAGDADAGPEPAGIRIDAFALGRDDADFLALNARVFRDHPEQGALDQAGLGARVEQDWFAADDFLLARDRETGDLLGYNWLKIDGGEGEIYVVGVADEAAGRGLGRALMRAGLARIHAAGVPRTTLYVEGDNERALGLYRSLGYGDDAVDVQYRRTVENASPAE